MRHMHNHIHHLGHRRDHGHRPRHDGRHGHGPFPFDHGPGFGHRGAGRRARRGDVRLAILLLLAEAPANGYSLIGQITARTDSRWRPSPGSIYPVLQHLAEEGLIARDDDEQGNFTITGEGRTWLAANQDQADRVWDNGRADSEAQEDLHQSMRKLMGATRELATSGTDEQRAQAAALLDEVRRTLYGMLSE